HPQDAQHGLVQPVLGDLPAADGGQDAVVGDVDVRREQQLVGAGLEGEDGHAVVAVLGAHPLHVEGVGDDHAVEAEFAAQHALKVCGGQGGRVVAGVERGYLEVRGHDRVDAGGDGGPEGRGVDAFPLLSGVGDDGQLGVAVLPGVAVAGEVL